MPRRVRCRICGKTHDWNEHNICVRCKKNKKYQVDYKETMEPIKHQNEMEDKKNEKEKDDTNPWIRELLEEFLERRVSFFTKDGTHTEGTLKEIMKDFIILDLTYQPYTSPDAVEVISNIDNVGLETFKQYFVRLDDIVGFGEVLAS